MFLYFSVGEKRLRANTTTAENGHLSDTLAELSETGTLTFGDFILPVESATLNNSSTREAVHDPSTTTSMSAIEDVYSDHNAVTESVAIPENDSGSDDSGTFTVTPRNTLSQSLRTTMLNSTLLAQEDVTQITQLQETVAMEDEVAIEDDVELEQNTSVGLQVDSRELEEKSDSLSVRAEIRDILKLQQQQLLSVLKTIEAKTAHQNVANTDCGTQIELEDESTLSQDPTVATTLYNRGVQSHTTQTLLEGESLDNTMPVSITQ